MRPKKRKAERNTIFLSKIYAGSNDRAASSAFSRKGWLITLFVICSILLALSSCEKPIEVTSSRDFIIRKGEHYASPRLFERFESGRLAFRARFDESAASVPAPHNVKVEIELVP